MRTSNTPPRRLIATTLVVLLISVLSPIAVGARNARLGNALEMDSSLSPQFLYAVSDGPIRIRYLLSDTSDAGSESEASVLASARGVNIVRLHAASTRSGIALIALGLSLVGGAVFMRRRLPG